MPTDRKMTRNELAAENSRLRDGLTAQAKKLREADRLIQAKTEECERLSAEHGGALALINSMSTVIHALEARAAKAEAGDDHR
jgi:hypothetical protein